VAVGLVAVALAGLTCDAQAAPSSTESLKSVLTAARARVEKTDVKVSGRLVEVAADGSRKNSFIGIKARWLANGLHMIVEISSPANAALRYSLTIDPGGRAVIETVEPSKELPVRVPLERWGDGLLGSKFSYEDLSDGQFLWSKQTLLPAARYGGRVCSVLQSEPGPGERSHYTSVTTWLDQKTGAPVHVKRVANGMGPTKELIMYDLRQTDGIWAARQIEAKLEGGTGSSLLILEHGSVHAHLQRKDFDFTHPAKH
jgi:hypothetical protein